MQPRSETIKFPIMNMNTNRLVQFPPAQNLKTTKVYHQLIQATCFLAELKGIAGIIPNENVLISNLTLQEAQSSSAIENIFTTPDELFKFRIRPSLSNSASKEVVRCAEALELGFKEVQSTGYISLNTIERVQGLIEVDRPGFRTKPGTVLVNAVTGQTVFTPPPPEKARELLNQLVQFIHEDTPLNPLVKMALIHHQFESIHPFYDGNGRTGRIINLLYLVKEGLLDTPILHLSRYISQNRNEYYRHLQAVRENDDWEPWLIFMLQGIAESAKQTIVLIKNFADNFLACKHRIRGNYKFYSHALMNSLFMHPYTKIEFLQKDMEVSRSTARRYLNELASSKILEKHSTGRGTYFVNYSLFDILDATFHQSDSS